MGNLNIKNLPEEVHEKLRARAAANHRSMNGEVIAILSAALERGERHPEAEALLRKAQALRERLPGPGLKMDEVDRAISQGRP